jgi:hypothetical protein
MMRTTLFSSLAIFLLVFSSCRSKVEDRKPVISVPFVPTTTIDIGKFIERVHYVQLENRPESAFTDIDKMIVSGGNMFMLDKRLEALFCFDTTGKFRYRIQRVGKGPGEYQELDAMWVKPVEKELWLQSLWPTKIMVYNFDGQMLREFNIRWSARDMVRLGNGLLAGYNSTRSDDGADSLDEGVFLLSEDGKYMGQPKSVGDSTVYWSMSYQRNLEEFGDGALLLTQSDTIFKIDRDGKVLPDAYLDWGELRIPDPLREICFNSPQFRGFDPGKYVSAKDQLVAFGPIRLFRIISGGRLSIAVADLNSGKGIFSTQLSCTLAKIPLLYPLAKSDRNELIGMYDMSLLLAMKESQANRPEDLKTQSLYQPMDSMVKSALLQDRPVLWFAKIKEEWLTKSY